MLINSSRLNLIRNTALASVGLVLLSGCHAFKDDLPKCPEPMANISFSYTMNMDYQDYFASSVHCLDLYVFKVIDSEARDGNASTVLVEKRHQENNDVIKTGNLSFNIPLVPGKYQAVVYGGMNCTESSFDKIFAENDKNLSIDDLYVAMSTKFYYDNSPETGDPEEDGIDHSALELHDHFYGISNVFDVLEQTTTPIKIDMMKNTNIINFYIVDKDKYDLEAHDYRMYIIDDNNEMGPDNLLIDSDDIVYRPYIKENTVSPKDATCPAIQSSFSVSKLSTRRTPKFAVVNKVLGNDRPLLVMNDLLDKLLAAKDSFPGASSMDDQEFLNRNDEWTIITEMDIAKQTWVSITVKVRDWEVRYDNIEAGF